MFRSHLFSACILLGFSSIVLLMSGCGGDGRPRIIAKGQIVDKGKAVRPDEKSSISIVFVEDVPAGKLPNSYPSAADPADGSFEVKGPDDVGIPKGKYRVKLSSLSMNPSPAIRSLNARFGHDTSPIFVEVVDAATPIVIDISKYK